MCRIGEHRIPTGISTPRKEFNSSIPKHNENEIEKQIIMWKKNSLIKKKSSDWNSRLVPVHNPNGTMHLE